MLGAVSGPRLANGRKPAPTRHPHGFVMSPCTRNPGRGGPAPALHTQQLYKGYEHHKASRGNAKKWRAYRMPPFLIWRQR